MESNNRSNLSGFLKKKMPSNIKLRILNKNDELKKIFINENVLFLEIDFRIVKEDQWEI